MALFGMGQKKQEKQKVAPKKGEATAAPKTKAAGSKKEKVEKAAEPVVVIAGVEGGLDLSNVLVRPHVTEKATDLSMKGVYAFDVHKSANKAAVKMAVEKYYKVSPVKVAIVNVKTKTTRSNKSGRTVLKKQGGKKALVYLKKGDKIEFV